MRGLRQLVLDTVRHDAVMNSLGLNERNVYPIYSRDSTPIAIEGSKFAVLRWGPSEPGIGISIPVSLDFWVYNRDSDYDEIMDVLIRGRTILKGLISQPTRNPNNEIDGWISGVDWQGGSPDLFDDLYNAYTRNESYRIVASGN